jgi:predicted phosphate transport protein (TIGR00153 family)
MEKWFEQRRRSKVLDFLYREMTLAIDTVNELEKAIAAFSRGERKEVREWIEKLFPTEEEIDNLRRAIFEELTRGSLPPKDREDIMHLVKRLDVMADHVKDSARSVLTLVDSEIPEEIWSVFVNMAKNLVDCANTLRASIEKLGSDPVEARALSQKVDAFEGKVDKDYLKVKGLFIKYGSKVDPGVLLNLKDLVESMECVADSCDDTADYVRILTVA